MARHRQPEELAKLKGAHKKNPQRYRGKTPKKDKKIGNPPTYMGAAAKRAWREIKKHAIEGVLTAADRLMLEMASNLLSEYRDNPSEFAVGKYTHLIGLLARFGMSPSDRTKLAIDFKGDEDDFEDLPRPSRTLQ